MKLTVEEIWPIIDRQQRGITRTELGSCLDYARSSFIILSEAKETKAKKMSTHSETVRPKDPPVKGDSLTIDYGQGDRSLSTPVTDLKNRTDAQMRLSGINHEGIELAKAMRRQSVCMFDRAKKGAHLDEFLIVKNIGQGACGKVFLVQHETTRSLYAMKAIRKDLVIDTDQLKNLYTEKNILQTADSPFLINMDFVFQDSLRIYFLMKFIKGGMLFSHLQNKDGAFSEEQVKFFILQVALGLGHLHSKEIVYRDLKPENVLIGEDGESLLIIITIVQFNRV